VNPADRPRQRISVAVLLAALTIAPIAADAQERYVEDIQVSRTGTIAEIVVDLACPMRWISDVLTDDARPILEVRVSPFESCRRMGSGSGIASEAYRPVGGRLAGLAEVEYESLGLGDDILFFRFEQPVAYSISQSSDLRHVIVTVGEPGTLTSGTTAPAGPSVAAAPAADAPAASPAGPSGQLPVSVSLRAPRLAADFVINLQSTREPVEQALIDSIDVAAERKVYISEITQNAQTWYRLRMGFFASEADAAAALEPLRGRFPRAWIGRAQASEIARAASTEFVAGGIVVESVEATAIVAAATPRATQSSGLSAEQIEQLADAAETAMLDRRYEDAIALYTQLLAEPGLHQQTARENLGLARERLGQLDRASAEYRAYLGEYPNEPGTARVTQRLESLATARALPRPALRSAAAVGESPWDFVSGFAQYYRRDVDTFDTDREDVIGLSALFTDVDFAVRRDGERFDLSSRISASNLHDLADEENPGPGDQTRVSYAYFDMIDTQLDWTVRVGRQSLHNWGVLGWFDGVHASYAVKTDQRVHFMSGFPVESTRDEVDTDRDFVGFAWDFDKLIGDADLSVFLNNQQIEGIDARRAVGAEMHYSSQRGNVTAMIDYDIDYAELNSILTLGAWRLSERTTVSGLVDVRKSPILTTRNALIGQPFTTIEELLLVWTEEEIRQLALDRTAQTTTATLGVSQSLGERFQLNIDFTATEIDGTIASAGVPALPGTGAQSYLTTALVGTGILGRNDVQMLNLRVGQGDDFDTTYLAWDARFPIGQRVRLNPRIRTAVRDNALDGTTRESVNAGLRILVNTRAHFRFEFEVGVDELRRSTATTETTTSGYYLNLGYRANY